MTSDMKKDLARDIKLGIHQFTDIIPEIYFRDDSESIMIVFEKVIPDKETISNIKSALKIFGNEVLLNDLSENKFMSLLIVRN